MAASTLSQGLLLTVPLAPLAGAIIAGFFGKVVGRRGAHWATILGVLIAFVCSVMVLMQVIDGARFNATIYPWMVVGKLVMEVGFLVDGLTAMMMVVVRPILRCLEAWMWTSGLYGYDAANARQA